MYSVVLTMSGRLELVGGERPLLVAVIADRSSLLVATQPQLICRLAATMGPLLLNWGCSSFVSTE